MTGAGAPGAAGIISCLKVDPSITLTVADADASAVGGLLNPDFVQIPLATDPGFTEALFNLCIRKNIRLVMPLVTKELLPLSQNIDRFQEAGTIVMVSSSNAITIANNKANCYRFLEKAGIELPRFFIANNIEEFMHAAFELGHPQKQFVFKPSESNGSRGVRIVCDSLDESDQLFHQKPYNLNISYAHALHILSSKPFPQLLLSEFLPGDEYAVDCLANKGRMVLAVPRLRQKTINGISVQGTFVHDEQVIDYCRRIIEAIGLHGNIGIQVRYSSEGRPLLLEINPRVQGTIVAAMGAGINLPLLAVKQELGLPVLPEETEIRWGTRFLRHWTEVYY